MASTEFKDNFSKQSDFYRQYRPHYPEALYAYLASQTEGHHLAWDAGTGNGQAAIGLAAHYEQVMATDPSEEQIRLAIPCKGVSYKVGKAEQAPFTDASVDLVTVANALHWFDWDAFYTEVARVLKPGGLLAVWTYGTPSQDATLDRIIAYFHNEILDKYWRPENRLVEAGYATIPFPYSQLKAPAFFMKKSLRLQDLLGLFHTWSAVQRYKDERGEDPVALITPELENCWGPQDVSKLFSWEIVLKLGRKY